MTTETRHSECPVHTDLHKDSPDILIKHRRCAHFGTQYVVERHGPSGHGPYLIRFDGEARFPTPVELVWGSEDEIALVWDQMIENLLGDVPLGVHYDVAGCGCGCGWKRP